MIIKKRPKKKEGKERIKIKEKDKKERRYFLMVVRIFKVTFFLFYFNLHTFFLKQNFVYFLYKNFSKKK